MDISLVDLEENKPKDVPNWDLILLDLPCLVY